MAPRCARKTFVALGRKISDVAELPSMGRVITLEQVRRTELRVEARDGG